MLKIRLTRRGKKNKAFFRIVVTEQTAPIKGRFLENLGFLNPHTKEKNLKEDRIKYWLEKGAQCSDTVHNLLISDGIIKGPKRSVKMKKKPVSEPKEEASEKKPAEETEVKSEGKETEKPVEEKEPEKKESEVAEPEPEKKEAEKKENEDEKK